MPKKLFKITKILNFTKSGYTADAEVTRRIPELNSREIKNTNFGLPLLGDHILKLLYIGK